jgi:hypothetical protein
MNDFRRSLRTILWHEPEESFPWQREGKKELPPRLVEEYSRWLTSAIEEKAASLCFLDITLCNIERTEFFGILLAPDESRSRIFKEVVTKLNTTHGESRTIGSHEVFQAGLPVFKNSPPPQTLGELQKCLGSGSYPISDNFLYWAYETNNNRSELKRGTEGELIQSISLFASPVSQKDFGHPEDPAEYKKRVLRASEYPVQENWKLFVEYLESKRADLLNARGEPLALVLGIPLCLWDYSEQRPNAIPVAQIFMGVGGEEAQAWDCAYTIARIVIMHALRSLGATQAKSAGELSQGSLFAHQAAGLVAEIWCDPGRKELQPQSEVCLWHLKSLIDLWGSFPLNPDASICKGTDADFPEWESLPNDELLKELMLIGLRHALRRGSYPPPESDPIGEKIQLEVMKIRSMPDPTSELWQRLNITVATPLPDWVRTRGFVLCFHHCFWQAAYHAIRAMYNSQRGPYLWIEATYDRVSVVNRAEDTAQNQAQGLSRDRKFFNQLEERLNLTFRIEGPVQDNGIWRTSVLRG